MYDMVEGMIQTAIETHTNDTELEPVILWARLISNILSPPVVWAVLAFPIALRDAESQGQAILWAGVYTLLVCLFPLAYIAWMVRQGKISDLHMKLRKERLRPFLVSMACTAVAWWSLRLMGAPPVVPQFALFSLVQITVMALITMVWQISMHAMSITCAVVAIGLLFGLAPALVATPLIPLVGAARLKLHRHTPAQVVAGTLVGALIPVLLFALVA
jgi:membrane-associated phospholipid phosphatase